MYNKEIASLDENQWELFAQDVLSHLGFTIEIGPSIGADDGLDLLVSMNQKKYLVSCKHNINSGKSVGVREEADISDRILQHNCQGFIAFYSTGPTTSLKRKFRDLEKRDISIMEIYKNDIFEIIPGMMGFVLQKYFSRPQEITHHIHYPSTYKPLICLEDGCGKDILAKENISYSMASLAKDGELLHIFYGCKNCINDINDCGWAEITQLIYIEQLIGWREMIDDYFSEGLNPAPEFYKNWALLQEGINQILIPPGWGRWLS